MATDEDISPALSGTTAFRAIILRRLGSTLAWLRGEQHPARKQPPKLFALLERWRLAKTCGLPGFSWIWAMRPPTVPLESPQVAVFQGHAGGVLRVAFSPDGRLVASSSADKAIRIWERETGKEAACLRGHTKQVEALAFASNGALLVSSSPDKTVRLWDPYAGVELARRSFSRLIHDLAVSPNGRHLFLACSDGEIKLCDLVSLGPPTCFAKHDLAARSVTVSPSGDRVASGSEDRTLRIWHSETGERLACLQGHERDIERVAFFPGGRKVISLSADNTIRTWDVVHCTEVGRFECAGDAWFMDVAISPDGRTVAAGSRDGTIRLWNASDGAERASLSGHETAVVSLAFSPDGVGLASGSPDGSVRLWRLDAPRTVTQLPDHQWPIWCVAFSPSGSQAATGSFDRTAKIWDVDRGRLAATFEGHESVVAGVAFSPDGKCVASASHDGTAILWDLKTGRMVRRLGDHGGRVTSIAFSSDGRRLLTVSFNRERARGLALDMGEVLRGNVPFEAIVGTQVTRSFFHVWDTESFTPIAIFAGSEDEVRSATFNEEGNQFVAIDRQKVRTWDWRTGRCLQAVDRDALESMATTPSKRNTLALLRTIGLETVLERVVDRSPLGWLPDRFEHVASHPARNIWGAASGRHFFLVALETEDAS